MGLRIVSPSSCQAPLLLHSRARSSALLEFCNNISTTPSAMLLYIQIRKNVKLLLVGLQEIKDVIRPALASAFESFVPQAWLREFEISGLRIISDGLECFQRDPREVSNCPCQASREAGRRSVVWILLAPIRVGPDPRGDC